MIKFVIVIGNPAETYPKEMDLSINPTNQTSDQHTDEENAVPQKSTVNVERTTPVVTDEDQAVKEVPNTDPQAVNQALAADIAASHRDSGETPVESSSDEPDTTDEHDAATAIKSFPEVIASDDGSLIWTVPPHFRKAIDELYADHPEELAEAVTDATATIRMLAYTLAHASCRGTYSEVMTMLRTSAVNATFLNTGPIGSLAALLLTSRMEGDDVANSDSAPFESEERPLSGLYLEELSFDDILKMSQQSSWLARIALLVDMAREQAAPLLATVGDKRATVSEVLRNLFQGSRR